MAGPTYQPFSPGRSHVPLVVFARCAIILVPGGAKGVALKLNSPNKNVQLDNLGFVRLDRSKFKVILH